MLNVEWLPLAMLNVEGGMWNGCRWQCGMVAIGNVECGMLNVEWSARPM